MIKRYDTVRVSRLIKNYQFVKDTFNKRNPNEGDVAVVLKVYEGPPVGYELECCDQSGSTIWRLGFSVNEIELEKVTNGNEFLKESRF